MSRAAVGPGERDLAVSAVGAETNHFFAPEVRVAAADTACEGHVRPVLDLPDLGLRDSARLSTLIPPERVTGKAKDSSVLAPFAALVLDVTGAAMPLPVRPTRLAALAVHHDHEDAA
ncbi:hypothetical protein ACWCRD_01635 [Streptomyces sp. NPDC002092]